MNVAAALAGALARVKSITSGTLSFNGNTATVYKSFARSYNREQQASGYNEFDDMSVLATPSDVSDWNLIPNQSQVTLDGVAYEVGQSITKTPDYWTIFLRLAK
jgi:hypothetical protein